MSHIQFNSDSFDKQLEKARQFKADTGIRLDIGCGENKQPGFIGLDWQYLPDVDLVWDIEIYPWPLDPDSVSVAIASHVVEHINPARGNFLNWMDEVWRVVSPGGQFAVSCPHGHSAGFLQDPTHCNMLNENSWAYFDPRQVGGNLYRIYRPKPWQADFLSFDYAGNMEVLLTKMTIKESKDYQENEK
jgi:SAM-dependent methyltransferase